MKTPISPNYLLPWFSDNEYLRGVQFENLMRWWLVSSRTLSTSTNKLVKVVRWEDWSGRPGRDLGTDLVGWDAMGRLWAIQCKAYAPSHLIGKSDVSQLVGDAKTGRGGKFFGRIYITTSDGYTANAKTIAKRNDVLLLSRSDLDLSSKSLPWPKSERELRAFLAGKAPKLKTSKPKPYQTRAIDKTVAHLRTFTRGQLIMACGTGKTLTSLWIKERLAAAPSKKRRAARVVVLVPSISLLKQTLQVWAENRSTEWKRLAVCSDSTAGSSNDENFEDMEAVDAGFEVTTDQTKIREFLRNTKGEQIIFSTYQSSAEVAAAARAEKIEFDLVICDEAHRLTGQTGRIYASVLDEQTFSARRRLFMTATPKVYASVAKKKAADLGYTVVSMDDSATFGEVAHQLSFKEAIEKGYLTDYQVVVAVITDTKAKELLAENRFIGLDGQTMTSSDLAAAIAVAKAAKRHKITRAISFHSTIKRSKQFVDTLEKLCAEKLPGFPRVLDAEHVDGTVSANERQRRLDRLKAGATGFNLLANARCLTEGVDVPALDGVAFVDPRQSEVDIVQALGRAIRLSANKEIGTIVVPVVCTAKEVAEGRLDAAGHKKLRQILLGLRSHDHAFGVQIDDFVFAQALSTGTGCEVVVPEKIKFEFEGDDLKVFAASIRTNILTLGSPDAEWAARYAAIKAFWAKHNRWPVFRGVVDGEKALAAWIGNQRQAWRNARLSQERIRRLEELSGWVWDPFASEWENNFESVRVFSDTHNRLPAFREVVDGEKALAAWIAYQRVVWKNNKLSQEHIQRLEELSGWVWDPFASEWENNFKSVRVFRDTHLRWPAQSASGEERGLALWIGTQRQAWKNNKLSPERIKLLEGLPGWSWDLSEDKWNQNFEAVRVFRNKHKRWPAQRASCEEGLLAAWIGNQRQAWKRNKLSLERVQRLESIPDWSWDLLIDTWNQNFEAVRVFRNKHKRWPARGASDEEGRLAVWFKSQRIPRRRDRLSPERIKLLEGLPGWSWDLSEDKWNQNFEAVRVFRNKHKRWPAQRASCEEGLLAAWIGNQRQAWKNNKIATERIKLLEGLPGWVWQARG
jgi:superfamily II DNA or RNA helicase/alkylated DNA repair dioxygenase AlkB